MTSLTLNYLQGKGHIMHQIYIRVSKKSCDCRIIHLFLINVCVCVWMINSSFLLRLSNLFHDGAFLLGNYLQPNHIHHPLAWVYWHHTTIQHQCQLVVTSFLYLSKMVATYYLLHCAEGNFLLSVAECQNPLLQVGFLKMLLDWKKVQTIFYCDF